MPCSQKYRAARAAGRCGNCESRKAMKGYAHCRECRKKMKAWKDTHRERIRKMWLAWWYRKKASGEISRAHPVLARTAAERRRNLRLNQARKA